MKKFIFTIFLSLLEGEFAVAHSGHDPASHIHLSESVSVGIGAVLAVLLSVASFYFYKKCAKVS
jgi:hypothetical protein